MFNVSYNIMTLCPITVELDEDGFREALEIKISGMAPKLKAYYKNSVHSTKANIPGFVDALFAFNVEIDDRLGDMVDSISEGEETYISLMAKLEAASLSSRDEAFYEVFILTAVGIADDDKTAIQAGKTPLSLEESINNYIGVEIQELLVKPCRLDFASQIMRILCDVF